ncbi:MAG: phosphoribosylformylglycinamidine synthase subunit PurQ [Rhodospirillales bacterium]
MKAAVIVFPGSNCDRDAAVALEQATGQKPLMLWHKDTSLPAVDLLVVPGGFSYGDYLRCGAIAAKSPIMSEVRKASAAGTPVLGICNGFQVLTESGLLPGVLMRNRGLKYICRDVTLRVERNDRLFTKGYTAGQVITVPIAHMEGNYQAGPDVLDRLEGDGQIAFRYCAPDGAANDDANPNGAARNIAGIFNDRGNVLGMMPHPERLADPELGGMDGAAMFAALAGRL